MAEPIWALMIRLLVNMLGKIVKENKINMITVRISEFISMSINN